MTLKKLKERAAAVDHAWFGNSRVVEKDGQPLIVYHGTRAEFDDFNLQFVGDLGFHFGTREQAMHFAGAEGLILCAHLKIERPLKLKDTFDRKTTAAQDVIWQLERLSVIPKSDVYELRALAISNHDYGEEGIQATWTAIRDAIEAVGYDGVVYENENEEEGEGLSWIVFHPEQIRLTVKPALHRQPSVKDALSRTSDETNCLPGGI